MSLVDIDSDYCACDNDVINKGRFCQLQRLFQSRLMSTVIYTTVYMKEYDNNLNSVCAVYLAELFNSENSVFDVPIQASQAHCNFSSISV